MHAGDGVEEDGRPVPNGREGPADVTQHLHVAALLSDDLVLLSDVVEHLPRLGRDVVRRSVRPRQHGEGLEVNVLAARDALVLGRDGVKELPGVVSDGRKGPDDVREVLQIPDHRDAPVLRGYSAEELAVGVVQGGKRPNHVREVLDTPTLLLLNHDFPLRGWGAGGEGCAC